MYYYYYSKNDAKLIMFGWVLLILFLDSLVAKI